MMQHMPALPCNRIQRGPRSTLGRVALLLIGLVCLSISLPYAALAQTSAPAPLPPAAQQALDKGIIAAKVPDYLLAIRFFEEARKLAPKAPVLFLNLGIAESKIPGRELRAIAWFGAYLAASPDAPNAAAVKEQIAVLDVKNLSNVSRLLRSVQNAAMQLGGPASFERDYQMRLVAGYWAQIGDLKTAFQTVDSIQSAFLKGHAYSGIASAQRNAGDYAGAQKTASLIEETAYKKEVQDSIRKSIVEIQNRSHEIPSVDNWITTINYTLDDALFLDLSTHLKSLPAKNAQNLFDGLLDTALKTTGGRQRIIGMLKQQAIR